MARYAYLLIPKTDMNGKTFTKELMQDLFDDLPDDSKLINIDCNWSSQHAKFTIESSQFLDTQGANALPEITYQICSQGSNSCGGAVVLDLSTALDPLVSLANTQTSCANCFGLGCGVCQHSWMVYNIPTFTYPIPANTPPVGVKTPVPTQSSISICTHEWKVYDSGFSMFEYCKHCNVKK